MDLTEFFTAEIRAAFPRRIALNTREVAEVLSLCGRECAQEQARRLLDAGALGKGLRPTSGGWLVPIPILAAGLAAMMAPAASASSPEHRSSARSPALPDRRRGRPPRTLAFALVGGPGLSDPPPSRRLFVLLLAPPARDEKPPARLIAFVDRVVADLHSIQTAQAQAAVPGDRAVLYAEIGEVPPAGRPRWKRKPGGL